MKKQIVSLLGLSAIFLLPSFALGQPPGNPFTGGGDGSTWNDAANWTTALPDASQGAVIGDGFTVGLATDQAINELDLVGDQSLGTATLNHSAGALTSGGWMKIGGNVDASATPSTGTYNLSGTASAVGQTNTQIGFRGGEGTLNVSDSANFSTSTGLNIAGGNVDVFDVAQNSTGALNVSGAATVGADRINLGSTGSTATVSQTGGTVTSNSWIALSNFGAGGTTTYDISGGSVFANNGNFAIGQEGDGTLNVSGSAVVSQSVDPSGTQVADALFVGQDGTSTGLLDIEGSLASVSGADFRVARDAGSVGTLSWTADANGITSIVSADNTEFGAGTSTLSLDLTADSNSSVAGTEYLLVNNGAAATGTFSGLAEGATVDLGGGNSGTISYVGGTDSFDIVVTASGGMSLTGDFDNDGDVDADDIDFYSGNLNQAATGPLAQLDLNTDSQVTQADHTLHVETYAQTSNGEVGAILGDANLDGIVDVLGDAASLVNNLGGSDVGYADGDFNADGVVDVLGDASILINNLGLSNVSEAAPATSAVPEPGSLSLLTLSWVALSIRRKR